MSKETELSAILSHAAQAGLLPNTIHSWLPALTRYTESIIAADRELRRGDALMPVVGKINVSDEDDCRFYRHVDDQTPAGSFPLVKLSDAQAALTAKDAEILDLEAQITVLKPVPSGKIDEPTKLLEQRCGL